MGGVPWDGSHGRRPMGWFTWEGSHGKDSVGWAPWEGSHGRGPVGGFHGRVPWEGSRGRGPVGGVPREGSSLRRTTSRCRTSLAASIWPMSAWHATEGSRVVAARAATHQPARYADAVRTHGALSERASPSAPAGLRPWDRAPLLDEVGTRHLAEQEGTPRTMRGPTGRHAARAGLGRSLPAAAPYAEWARQPARRATPAEQCGAQHGRSVSAARRGSGGGTSRRAARQPATSPQRRADAALPCDGGAAQCVAASASLERRDGARRGVAGVGCGLQVVVSGRRARARARGRWRRSRQEDEQRAATARRRWTREAWRRRGPAAHGNARAHDQRAPIRSPAAVGGRDVVSGWAWAAPWHKKGGGTLTGAGRSPGKSTS